MQAGDVVPLATIGTTMPDGREIGRRKILGIASDGMLCSAAELGPRRRPRRHPHPARRTPRSVGRSLEALGVTEDVVFDLDLTRNRPDAYGHLGVARDLAARFGVPLLHRLADADGRRTGPRAATVEIVDPDRLRTLRLRRPVRASRWARRRRGWPSGCPGPGMRPINNVVDVSNYVMLELNEPNHAYDLDTLGGGGFRIRRAVAGETMVTLDGVERTFTPDDLLICDAEDRAIGIAGVMGGADTEISDGHDDRGPRDGVVRARSSSPARPRGSALRSEASTRFERGRDPYGIDRAVARFVELLRETCPGLVVHAGAVDARASSRRRSGRSGCGRSAVNALLGADIETREMVERLAPIGFTATLDQGGVMDVEPALVAPDCELEVDVIEEIARHVGYERLGRTVPKSVVAGRLSPVQARRRLVRQVLYGLGISEAMPNPFLAPGDLGPGRARPRGLAIANPLVAEESVLRTSLRPGLLKAVAYNASHRADDVVAVRDRPRLPARRRRRCPTSARCSPSSSPAGTDRPRCPCSSRCSPRSGAPMPLRHRPVARTGRPGLHPGRSGSVPRSTAMRRRCRSARSIPACSTPTTSPAGWPGWSSTCRRCWPWSRRSRSGGRSAGSPPATSTSPSWRRTTLPAAGRAGARSPVPRGELLADVELFDVYRGPGIEPASAAWPSACASRLADHTLTDAEVAQVRERAIERRGSSWAQRSAADPVAPGRRREDQLLVTSSGMRSPMRASAPPWRRSTSRQRRLGGRVKGSARSASTTIQALATSSSSSCPGAQPA